jgi:hypothetical protein
VVTTLAFAVLVAGCTATTTIETNWSDARYMEGRIGKILVLGLSPHSGIRESFENSMKRELIAHGVEAVASLDLLFHEEEVTRELLEEVIQDTDIDGVLVSRLIAHDLDITITPARDLWGYYNSTYVHVHSPGYLTMTEIVRVETSLYDADSAMLAWRGVSETFDPLDAEDVIKSLSSGLVEKLIEEGFLGR